jgi:hypothetical protein
MMSHRYDKAYQALSVILSKLRGTPEFLDKMANGETFLNLR